MCEGCENIRGDLVFSVGVLMTDRTHHPPRLRSLSMSNAPKRPNSTMNSL